MATLYRWLARIPMPICSVALGFAGLGNLLQPFSANARRVCGVIAAFCLALFLVRSLCHPHLLKSDLKNPIATSVAPTFAMALSLLTVYAKSRFGVLAFWIWLLAIGLHLSLIIYFTARFVIKLEWQSTHASYFVVYVGIAMCGVTAPAFHMEAFGAVSFWLALVCWFVMLLLITYRYAKHPLNDPSVRPLLCIYTAPMSLAIASYLQSVNLISLPLLLVLYAIATFFYIIAMTVALRVAFRGFYTSFAAMTFPFVISAIASTKTHQHLMATGVSLPWISVIAFVQTIVAVLFCSYVLVHYTHHLVISPAIAKVKRARSTTRPSL